MSDDSARDATDERGTDDAPLPTWADLFARGEAVGATESGVRETLRSRRDA